MPHLVCHYCGSVIPLPFECRDEYPLLFKATCPKCRRTDVYHAVEVREHNPEKCEEARRKAEELANPLNTLFTIMLLHSVSHATGDIIIRGLRKTLERVGGGEC
jgi:hypothetical protein